MAAAAAGAASLGIAAPAVAQRARVFRFGHMLAADTGYHRAIQMFADEAGKLSSGKIKIEIYPAPRCCPRTRSARCQSPWRCRRGTRT
jgi:C4-dicarboxylate-binding protein DctP